MRLAKKAQTRFLEKCLKSTFAALLLASVAIPTAVRAEESQDAEGGGDYLQKLTGLAVHGFANMGFGVDNSTDNHRRFARGFYLNNFDLYYNPDMGNRVRFLSEVVFEPGADDQAPGFDAERLQAGYVVNNNLTVWVGRFHTPIGYYVLAYHHGGELQTAVEKPRFLDFEDHYGILPVHTNGLWLNGNFTLGDQRIALMGWVGNADRIVTDGANFTALDFNMVHSDNHQLSEGARINWVANGALDGFQLGATVLHERIDDAGTGGVAYGGKDGNGNTLPSGGNNDATANPNTGTRFSSNFLLYGMHAVYEAHGIEFLNEIYAFHNSDALNPGPTYNSYAGYSQLAYWINGNQAPFVRFERGAFNQRDPYFASQYNGLPYHKWAFGYRYSVTDNAAVKIELSNVGFGSKSATNLGQDYKDIHLDYSIRF